MELVEGIVSHLVAGLVGAGLVWYPTRSIRRQFRLMMETIDQGKQQGKDWKFVRDAEGNPVGFRVMLGASASTDKPGSI